MSEPRGYSASAGAKADPENSLTSQTNSILRRLADILRCTEGIGDTLHGSGPKEAAAESPPAPFISVGRNLENAHQLLNMIDHSIQRIQGKL